MKTLYTKNVRAVSENLPKLQSKLKVGITIKGNTVTINGKEENVYDAEKVFEAIDAGFDPSIALLLASPEYLFEVMNVKSYTRRTNLKDVRARLIGTGGKTKMLMEKLSDSYIKIKGNTIYIVGPAEDMRDTMTAVEKLIRGSAQGKVYGFLERSRTQHKYDTPSRVDDKNLAEGESTPVRVHKRYRIEKKVKKSKPKKIDHRKLGTHQEEDFDSDDDYNDDLDIDSDDLDNDEEASSKKSNGNKKVSMKPLKKSSPKELKNDELARGIKNLQDPDDEGLEFED
jgi:KH domain-containing protein